MLAIRLQRLGRKGYATYRLAVQESQRHPSSGRVVAYVGSYNPHTKAVTVKIEDAQKYLDNGAQPTPRVVKLLKDAGVKLPSWVVESSADKTKAIRHADKLRKNQPAVEEPEIEEVVADETPEVVETPEEAVEETPVEPTEEPASEAEVAAEEAAADETEA